MSDPLSLQPGQIIPQCGTTLDVYAACIGDILVSGKPLDGNDDCVTEMEWVQPGLLRVTLALWAGHRVMVRYAESKDGDP